MTIPEIQEKISPVLHAHGIRRASVFGSVSRGDDRPESDIDILVRLGKPMGLFAYMGLIRELEARLGRRVDLVTEKSLNKFIKPHVLPEMKTIYEE